MLIALAGPVGQVTAQAHTCPSVLEPAQLLTEHAAFVDTLACGMQAKAVRRRGGRVLLGLHPDLAAWMSRPAPDRLAEVRRLDAWPFLSWCFATGRLVPDLDLLAGKGRGAHFTTWLALHPEDEQRALEAAEPFGWCPAWATRVVGNALPLLCLTRATTLDELNAADLDAVQAQIAVCPSLTRASLNGGGEAASDAGGADACTAQGEQEVGGPAVAGMGKRALPTADGHPGIQGGQGSGLPGGHLLDDSVGEPALSVSRLTVAP